MKNRKIAFLFPGQGCQYYHMAKPLYKNNLYFRNWLNNANQISIDLNKRDLLAYLFSESKSKLMLFTQLEYTQPLITLISVGIAHLLVHNGIDPDLLIGTSLGEISACLFSGIITLEKFLCAIEYHTSVFLERCKKGNMVVVLANKEVLNQLNYQDVAYELCAENYPGNIVIGGLCDDYLHLVNNCLAPSGVIFEKLPVEYAFHTRHIDSVKDAISDIFSIDSNLKSLFPIYSSAGVVQVDNFDCNYFWSVVRDPIYFSKLISKIDDDYLYVDVGPSGNLANMVINNLPKHSNSKTYSVLSPFIDTVNIDVVTNCIHDLCVY